MSKNKNRNKNKNFQKPIKIPLSMMQLSIMLKMEPKGVLVRTMNMKYNYENNQLVLAKKIVNSEGYVYIIEKNHKKGFKSEVISIDCLTHANQGDA